MKQGKRRVFWFALGALAAYLLQGVIVQAEQTAPPPRYAEVTEDTPTLWDIAAKEMPAQEPRKAVWEIRQLNGGIDPGQLQIGQRVRLPGKR